MSKTLVTISLKKESAKNIDTRLEQIKQEYTKYNYHVWNGLGKNG